MCSTLWRSVLDELMTSPRVGYELRLKSMPWDLTPLTSLDWAGWSGRIILFGIPNFEHHSSYTSFNTSLREKRSLFAKPVKFAEKLAVVFAHD
jgi:hypothetical protein